MGAIAYNQLKLGLDGAHWHLHQSVSSGDNITNAPIHYIWNSLMRKSFDHRKYQAFPPVQLPNRRWPDQQIRQAPTWCSVDLRDGNQALIDPMTVEQKSRMFDLLVAVGFKEIEVGFPAASQPDYDFVRMLVEQQRIPNDVTIQILTQARKDLIERSFEALHGVSQAIVHVYNSTSVVQRQQVFNMSREQIKKIATNGATWVKQCAQRQPETKWTFQYSPESFTGTELEFALDVCEAVSDIWLPVAAQKVIFNLPATVEMSTPNVYADQIEWFCQNIKNREAISISLHTHNDRGCAVAAAELGMMAGAERVEGTLLGNGERTGNMDIVTMAMNLYSQGIDPQLDLSNMDEIIRVIKHCTQMPVHPRHPYAGELVYTAFSGSHQDAINKCLAKYREGDIWNAAYLPIDPRDLGRTYQEVIRINSQSGKGGVAYVLAKELGLKLPRWLQIQFSKEIQRVAEDSAKEVTAETIWSTFQQCYLCSDGCYQLNSFTITSTCTEQVIANLSVNGQAEQIVGKADGVLEAFLNAISDHSGLDMDIVDYSEHSLGHGVDESAVAYLHVKCNSEYFAGVAIDKDIIAASLNAVLSAVNQCLSKSRPSNDANPKVA